MDAQPTCSRRPCTSSATADAIACGPDLDEIAESARPFIEAGFTDIAIVQVGDRRQDDFLREAAGPLLERLRAL